MVDLIPWLLRCPERPLGLGGGRALVEDGQVDGPRGYITNHVYLDNLLATWTSPSLQKAGKKPRVDERSRTSA